MRDQDKNHRTDPANWTSTTLKQELEKLNIFVLISLGKNMLKKLYVENVQPCRPVEQVIKTKLNNRMREIMCIIHLVLQLTLESWL